MEYIVSGTKTVYLSKQRNGGLRDNNGERKRTPKLARLHQRLGQIVVSPCRWTRRNGAGSSGNIRRQPGEVYSRFPPRFRPARECEKQAASGSPENAEAGSRTRAAVALEEDRPGWALRIGVSVQEILPPSSFVGPTRHEIVEYGLLHLRWERLATDDGQGGRRPPACVELDEGAIPGGRQYMDSRLRGDGEVTNGTRQKLKVEVHAEVDGEDVSTGRSCGREEKSWPHMRQGNTGKAGSSWRLQVDLRGAVSEPEAAASVRTSMKNIGSALTGSRVEFGEEEDT
ncbi:hypothetical protein C8R44DRAFT_751370 [Mycena epipterygia]|nr:hypothetical protein C8R44DRAFT_751370 [Mycena epipterygia]